jgi:hypothetical protein
MDSQISDDVIMLYNCKAAYGEAELMMVNPTNLNLGKSASTLPVSSSV